MRRRRHPRWTRAVALGIVLIAGCTVSGHHATSHDDAHDRRFAREQPFVIRPFELGAAEDWRGEGIAYGPYRDGQYPGGPSPSDAELLEDLRLMARHWRLLRTYGSVGPPEAMIRIIDEQGIDMKVLLGVWIGREERRDSTGAVVETFPEEAAANRGEIEAAVRLAETYPSIVAAVCVGNETQVSWSAHQVDLARMVDDVREVRSRTSVPVTVADDHMYWREPENETLAAELDFIVVHAHPLWNGIRLDDALEWTRATVAAIQALHPDRPVVLGETGWATAMRHEGEQGRLIKGETGEDEQRTFYRELRAWVRESRVPTFFFEAFDENWKGGPQPDEVEKHWGLFRADRAPKKAIADAD